MSDMVRGMVVYHRDSLKRGVVTASNQFTAMLAVAFDDGTRELLHVSKLMSEKLYNEIKEEDRKNQMALKPEQAIIGAVVYQAATRAPLRKGKIAGPLDNAHGNNLVIVEWSDGTLAKWQIKALLSEVDGIAENQRLLDEQAEVEREFEEAKEAIGKKLAAATKLINEAATIASEKDVDILGSMYEDTRELEYAMENAGWRTSSWHC